MLEARLVLLLLLIALPALALAAFDLEGEIVRAGIRACAGALAGAAPAILLVGVATLARHAAPSWATACVLTGLLCGALAGLAAASEADALTSG